MEGSYDVLFNGRTVGQVVVTRQGLYYKFHCRCRLPEATVLRLWMRLEGALENLGILAPVDGMFGLDTKIPFKRLGQGSPQFFARGKAQAGGKFIPLRPEEPFSYIARLKNARLERRDGTTGILLADDCLTD